MFINSLELVMRDTSSEVELDQNEAELVQLDHQFFFLHYDLKQLVL